MTQLTSSPITPEQIKEWLSNIEYATQGVDPHSETWDSDMADAKADAALQVLRGILQALQE
jgi:truncated hemoglobin YjbI